MITFQTFIHRFLTNILISKVHMLQPYAATMTRSAMLAIVRDFDDNFDWVAKMLGCK